MRLIIFSVIVIIFAAAIGLLMKGNPLTIVTAPVASSTNVENPSPHVLVSDVGQGGGGEIFPAINTKTKDIISLKDDVTDSAQNPAFYVYLNQKKIGLFSGYPGEASFSPDNHYFVFRSTSDLGCAGTCLGYAFDVIDTTRGTMVEFLPHPTNGFVDSFIWGNDTLDATMYLINPEYSGNQVSYYRTSPKQIWRYDLLTQTSELLKTLPEPSSTSY